MNGKKNNSKKPCVNPIFEKWIIEWREDAIARELNSRHTLLKCLNSLRKYPMPLNCGKDCIILEGFGDKICKNIDEKLQTFVNDGGILHEPDDSIVIGDSSTDDEALCEIEKISSQNSNPESSKTGKYKDKAFSFATKKPVKISNEKEKQGNTECVNVESNIKKVIRKTNNGKKKEYIPEPRTGPHALIITLFNHENNIEQNESQEGLSYMLKSDLISQAQPHCNSLFTSSDASNGSNYTAWNSMSGLIKKELVTKSKNVPAKYALTESGKELASKLLFNTENENSESEESDKISPVPKLQKTKLVEGRNDKNDEIECLSPRIESRVQKKSDCIELNSDSSSDNDIIITDDKDDNKKEQVSKKNYDYVTGTYRNVNLDDSGDDLPDIGFEEKKTKVNIVNKTKPVEKIKENKNFERKTSTTNLTQEFTNLKRPSDEDIPKSNGFNVNKYFSRAISQKSASIIYESSYNTIDSLYSFEPGTYDILLFVDNCEQTAKKQDILIEELRKSKIKFDIGKLNVSDFTWVARPKNSTNSEKDLILNCVLERKRMDDFCSSILDGRYKEQKFRLKKCGISKQIYLIEDHGSMKHMSLPEKSLLQADVNTQIIDHLIVHHTTDPKDTAHYLIELTHYITRAYRSKKLNACSKDQLDNLNKSEETLVMNNCMTLKEFNAFSNKNKPLTMKEMFAKCLMKIQGLSQEKCLAIIELYPTLEALMTEYSDCASNKREKLLANVKYGSAQRNLGPAISKLVAQLFYTTGSLC